MNFLEMQAFVKLGAEFAADTITFNIIRQRDIFSREEYVEALSAAPITPNMSYFSRR